LILFNTLGFAFNQMRKTTAAVGAGGSGDAHLNNEELAFIACSVVSEARVQGRGTRLVPWRLGDPCVAAQIHD